MRRSRPEYNATVVGRVDITRRLMILEARLDTAGIPFRAGQYTVLGLKRSAPRITDADDDGDGGDPEEIIRRPYSICSAEQEPLTLEFYVSLINSGQLTPRLFAMRIGDRLHVGPQAKGMLTLDTVRPDHNLLLIATGTGLGPYISMLRSRADALPDQEIAVIHGAHHSWDLAYRPELELFARRYPRFHYLPLVSRPQEDPLWNGLTGRIQPWLTSPELSSHIGFLPSPTNTNVFLCGNPNMVQEGLQILSGQGYEEATHKTPGNLHAEKYW